MGLSIARSAVDAGATEAAPAPSETDLAATTDGHRAWVIRDTLPSSTRRRPIDVPGAPRGDPQAAGRAGHLGRAETAARFGGLPDPTITPSRRSHDGRRTPTTMTTDATADH